MPPPPRPTLFPYTTLFRSERARDWFRRGLPLIEKVDRALAIDIELFSRGGMEILDAIERQGFDVLRRRPAISKTRKLRLLLKARSEEHTSELQSLAYLVCR